MSLYLNFNGCLCELVEFCCRCKFLSQRIAYRPAGCDHVFIGSGNACICDHLPHCNSCSIDMPMSLCCVNGMGSNIQAIKLHSLKLTQSSVCHVHYLKKWHRTQTGTHCNFQWLWEAGSQAASRLRSWISYVCMYVFVAKPLLLNTEGLAQAANSFRLCFYCFSMLHQSAAESRLVTRLIQMCHDS